MNEKAPGKENEVLIVNDNDLEEPLTGKVDADVDSRIQRVMKWSHLNWGVNNKGCEEQQHDDDARTGFMSVFSNNKLSFCFIFSCVGGAIIMIGAMLLNPTETYGVIATDYTNIQSEYDLSLGKMNHWCLGGVSQDCECEDPLEPTFREFKWWTKAHKQNKKRLEAFLQSDLLDVVFMGESLVEEMGGRWMGRTQGEELKIMEHIFNRNFKREKSGMEGIALGIAGDTSPNVFWRIMHGEMPSELNPRVWWISLGMNDLSRTQCSEEAVLLGILRAVEELHSRRPDARIVINSLLPMANLRGDLYPQENDYKDSFRTHDGERPTISSGTNTSIVQNPLLDIVEEVRYQRPIATTKALYLRRHRHFVIGPGGVPTLMYPRFPSPQTIESTNHLTKGVATPASRSGNNDRVLSSTTTHRRLDMMKDGDNSGGEGTKSKIESQTKKPIRNHLERIQGDPEMDFGVTRIKRRDPKTLFIKTNPPPLWSSIHAINKELRKFCEKHELFTFFDATDIFAERIEGSKYTLKTELISTRGHPTIKGFALWEDAVRATLKRIFERDDVELAKELKDAEEMMGGNK